MTTLNGQKSNAKNKTKQTSRRSILGLLWLDRKMARPGALVTFVSYVVVFSQFIFNQFFYGRTIDIAYMEHRKVIPRWSQFMCCWHHSILPGFKVSNSFSLHRITFLLSYFCTFVCISILIPGSCNLHIYWK